MNLEEELQNAFIEVLQERWDERLFDTWQSHKDWQMGKTLYCFLSENNADIEMLSKLKRIGAAYLKKVTIARYIAEFLPELNSLLWDSKLSKEEILKRMKSMVPLKNALHYKEMQNMKNEINRDRKTANAASASRRLVRDQRARISRGSWSTVK